ncbi:MAG: IS3 family transposase [Desulfobacteraceae bacterium]
MVLSRSGHLAADKKEEAKVKIFDYISYYNADRSRSSSVYLSPMDMDSCLYSNNVYLYQKRPVP